MNIETILPEHKLELLMDLSIQGVSSTWMLALAMFLIFMPMIKTAHSVPAWFRALLSIWPATYFAWLAVFFPSVITIVGGCTIGLSPLWILILDWSGRRSGDGTRR